MLRLITKHSEYGEFNTPDLFLRSDHFYASALHAQSEFALGITISKRIGKAHLRNLLKRRVKAWLRLRGSELPQRYRVNLIARPGAAELDWQGLCRELNSLAAQLGERSPA